jgi:hypothetical protein
MFPVFRCSIFICSLYLNLGLAHLAKDQRLNNSGAYRRSLQGMRLFEEGRRDRKGVN